AEFQGHLELLRSVPRLDGWEIHLRTPDGEPVPASASVSAVRESDRRVASLRWILRDGVDRSGADDHRLLVQSEADRLRLEMAAARLRKLQAITDVMLRHLGVEELLRGLLDAVRDT